MLAPMARVRTLASACVGVILGAGSFRPCAAPPPPPIAACDCKWPDMANPPGLCDSPPKLCGYCTAALAYMFYGPESSATVGCLVEGGRNVEVCERVAAAVQVR